MVVDRSQVMAGLLLYGLLVLLPTTELLLHEAKTANPVLERIIVGIAGSFSGSLVVSGLHIKGSTFPQLRYWRPNLLLLIASMSLFVLAWFTNLPKMVASQVADGAFAARISTGLLTVAAWRILRRGLWSPKPTFAVPTPPRLARR